MTTPSAVADVRASPIHVIMWRRIDVTGAPTSPPVPRALLRDQRPPHPLPFPGRPASSIGRRTAAPPHTTLTAQLICRVDWNAETRLSNRRCRSSIFNAAHSRRRPRRTPADGLDRPTERASKQATHPCTLSSKPCTLPVLPMANSRTRRPRRVSVQAQQLYLSESLMNFSLYTTTTQMLCLITVLVIAYTASICPQYKHCDGRPL